MSIQCLCHDSASTCNIYVVLGQRGRNFFCSVNSNVCAVFETWSCSVCAVFVSSSWRVYVTFVPMFICTKLTQCWVNTLNFKPLEYWTRNLWSRSLTHYTFWRLEDYTYNQRPFHNRYVYFKWRHPWFRFYRRLKNSCKDHYS